jgi:hypothetical protein
MRAVCPLLIAATLLLCCSDQGSGNGDAGRDSGAADHGAADTAVRPDQPTPDRGGTAPDQAAPDSVITPDGGAPDHGGGTPDLALPDSAPVADLAMAGDALLARCKPMDARGDGPCDMLIGVKWDGKQCVNVSGCRCIGADCSKLFKNKATCQAAYVGCP